MRKLFMLCAVVLLASCSGDDDKNINEGPKKFMTSIAMNDEPGTGAIQFEYDENKNLKAILENGDVEYSFAYNTNNELTAINDGNSESVIEILYDNGQLSGYMTGGETYPIAYNVQTNKYVFNSTEIEVALKGRDLGAVNDAGGANRLTLDYNTLYKGPMYNVPTKNIFLLSLFLNLYYYVSTSPVTGITEGGTAYTTENTYDEDGFVTQMVIESDTQTLATVKFSYSEL